MEDKRNVKWILIVSIIMFFASMYFVLPSYYYPSGTSSFSETIWYVLGRAVTLLFLVTITSGALFTTNFGKKELAYKLTIRLFVLSMGLLFLQFLRVLFTIP